MAMNLTEHFTLEELYYSNTAEKKGIDNAPNNEIKEHLELLATNILEPLRLAWGSGIKVSSGFRSEKLNKTIGGSGTSAHVFGWAADLVPSNGKISEFKAFVLKWLKNNNVKFDQYINEFSGTSQWVHIGLYNRAGQQRKQYLRYKNGVYSKITN
jgi:zinc D-Ala-D-Ala carboxypeptidase